MTVLWCTHRPGKGLPPCNAPLYVLAGSGVVRFFADVHEDETIESDRLADAPDPAPLAALAQRFGAIAAAVRTVQARAVATHHVLEAAAARGRCQATCRSPRRSSPR